MRPYKKFLLLLVFSLGSPWIGASKAQADPRGQSSPYSLALLGSYRKSMEIEPELLAACKTYGLSPALARGVLLYESGGNDGLISGAGARGYFQVMPPTYRMMKVGTNIEAGVKYLSILVRDLGREDDALAAYNGGPGRLERGRKLPTETLQYVVGVGAYRTLLTNEEPAIREAASKLDLYRVRQDDGWALVSAKTGIPVLELRLYNAFLAPRPLRAGMVIAHPRASEGAILSASSVEGGLASYVTRRGDNYLLLAFAFDVELDQFRSANALWRIQVPFEGVPMAVARHPATNAPIDDGGAIAVAAVPAQADTPDSGAAPIVVAAAVPSPPAGSTSGALTQTGSVRKSSGSSGGSAAETRVHRVKRGETLYGISRHYGVPVASIRDTNGLKRLSLLAGQTLLIPVP